MTRARALALAALVTLGACASDPVAERASSPRSASLTPSVGVGEVTSADESVEDAETATAIDEERAGFHGKIDRIPDALAAEMRGTTWKPGCPVPLEDLRLLHFNYWGFDGAIRRGPMVVNAAVTEDVLWVFGQMFEERFPLKRVALATEFKPGRFAQHRRITSHRSVTAAFNCRPVVTPLGPGDSYSQHSYGLAIDVNPLQNPYVTASGFVRNRIAERYVDRGRDLEGMIHVGDVVYRSFTAIGWEWGGHWSGDKDYMHFSGSGT